MGWVILAKTLASACFVLAAAAWAWLMTSIIQRRPKELREMRTALQMLETEISYAATPLPVAFQLIEERLGGKTARFFERVTYEMNKHHTAGEAWRYSVDLLYSQMAWNREDRAILKDLAPTLGLSDKKNQLKHLRLCQERLNRAEEIATERMTEKVRLYRSLGLLLGLLVALLVW